ncbi:hypothetical protein NP233_g10002 [Leucocoprinus birnbaumii]|uniref:Terpene synthase n=1 Tax=Leucocoprinus birnbaumii TaxID=56174 RepID=A0AAD5YLR0_9AGAR|nr:hypothetical protein NP233_g10002 [Leucocoprinus birnbaumii]
MSPPIFFVCRINTNAPNKATFSEKLCEDYPMVKNLDPFIGPNTSPLPAYYTLPRLVEDCPYEPTRCNPDIEHRVARQCETWFLGYANYDSEHTARLMGLKAGELTSACYPIADEFHLRTVADYLTWLFQMDDWTDDYGKSETEAMKNDCMGAMRDPLGWKTEMRGGSMVKDYTARLAQTAGPGCLNRFIENMELFFKAVVSQANDRSNNKIPTLEEYIDIRRDTSGCKPCFQLAEFVGRFDLPQEVVENERIMRMEQSTNDLVTWSNDIFSYDKEQIRDDKHSMIPITMHHYGLGLQEAIEFVGAMCKRSVDNFVHDRTLLMKEKEGVWSKDVMAMVKEYALGLEHWISGSLHWSFETQRYFGTNGQEVKRHKIVNLSPKFPSTEKTSHNLPN